jgi:glycosyltransferase involved in cell wall biosynthesis
MNAGRLRVTFYSDAAFYGGAEVYLSLLARHLDRNRFSLSAMLPGDPPVERLEAELGSCGVVIRRHRRLGFRWWDAFGDLRGDLRALGGDILHVNLPSTYDAGLSSVAVAARMAGYRRVVATEHLPMIRRRYRRFPIKFVMSEAIDLFLVPAEASRRFLVQLHRIPWEKTRVIPLGVDPPADPPAGLEDAVRAETATPRGSTCIGIVGSLTARKGHRVLLDALAILMGEGHAAGESLRLWVIGEGEDRAELEARADALGLKGTVRFLGARPDAALLMRMIDLLVVPSLMETTPFVVLEAMSASRPVVASRIFGIPEIVADSVSGILVRPNDPADLAQALRPLIEDRTKREAMGVAGRRMYESLFTAERMARKTEAAYLGDDLPASAGAVAAVEGAGDPSSGGSKGRAA